jgi:cation diffusion facilitator CzcD-associated flavoprotein CzcO
VLRATLTPDYIMGCKRVLISNDYFPALCQPHVSVITDPLERFAATGVRSGGQVRPTDVVILATGFKPMDLVASVQVQGRDKRSLNEEWASAPSAYLGIMASGFPNLFFCMGPHTGLGHNSMIYMIESQVSFILKALQHAERTGARALDVQPAAQMAFDRSVAERLKPTVWAQGGCHSWYMTADGRIPTLWPDFTFRYRRLTQRLDAGAFELMFA